MFALKEMIKEIRGGGKKKELIGELVSARRTRQTNGGQVADLRFAPELVKWEGNVEFENGRGPGFAIRLRRGKGQEGDLTSRPSLIRIG